MYVETTKGIIATWKSRTVNFNYLEAENQELKTKKRSNETELQKWYERNSGPGRLSFCADELLPEENFVTDVLINIDYNYYITGTQSGEIIVWKFDEPRDNRKPIKVSEKDKGPVHRFSGHIKAVKSIVPVTDTAYKSKNNSS